MLEFLSIRTSVASAGTEIVEANNTTDPPLLIIPIVTSAALVPSMFAITILFIFITLSLAQVNKSVVTVVSNSPFILFAYIEVTFTKFGFAIFFSYFIQKLKPSLWLFLLLLFHPVEFVHLILLRIMYLLLLHCRRL